MFRCLAPEQLHKFGIVPELCGCQAPIKKGGFVLEFVKGVLEEEGVSIPYFFTKLGRSRKKLAILLPGKEYTTQGPMFWYANQVYLEQNFDTLQFQYPFMGIEEDKLPKLVHEMMLSFLQQHEYDSIHFVSLGLGSTIVAYSLMQDVFSNVQCVWYSPYIHQDSVLDALLNRPCKGLVFLGDESDLYHDEGARLIEEEHLIVAQVGGNAHFESVSIEINIETMASIAATIKQFIQHQEIELIEEKTSIRVYFSLYGNDFPLDEASEKLGLQPTNLDKDGNPIIPPIPTNHPNPESFYQVTDWELSTNDEESMDLEVQMNKIIGKLRSKVPVINELRDTYGLKSHLQVVLHVHNGKSPIMTLDKRVIEFAYEIQTEFIDFDIYVFPFDENPRFECKGFDFKGRKL